MLQVGAATGDEEYELFRVAGMTRLVDGRIAVLSAGSNDLRFYDTRGAFVEAIGRQGQGPGEFESPYLLCRLAADSLLVAEHSRVQIFDSNGELARIIRPGWEEAVRLWYVGCSRERLLGQLLLPPSPDETRSVWRDSMWVVWADIDGAALDTIGRFPTSDYFLAELAGGMGRWRRPVPFSAEAAWSANASGAYFGPASEPDIHLYDTGGILRQRISLETEASKIGPEDVDRFESLVETRRQAVIDQGRTPSPRITNAIPYPASKPYYDGIMATSDGAIWVREYRDPWSDTDVLQWLVLDSAGVPVHRVRGSADLTIYEATDEYVLGRWRDSLGIEYVHLYELPPARNGIIVP